jgi:hypothetical protein
MTCLRHGSKFRINYYKLLIILNLNSECLILAVLMTFFLGVAGALGSIRERERDGSNRVQLTWNSIIRAQLMLFLSE